MVEDGSKGTLILLFYFIFLKQMELCSIAIKKYNKKFPTCIAKNKYNTKCPTGLDTYS
jgi:hypothetical protein